MGHQTIVTPSGDELVVLSRADYDNLVRLAAEAEEDAADVAIYDARRAEASPQLPAAVTMAMLRGESRLKAIRTWKGVGQVNLAKETGTSQGFISDLESGRRGLTDDIKRRVAEALDVPEAWL